MLGRSGLFVSSLTLSALCLPSFAHHSRVNFSDEIVAFQATVTRFEWVNPHVYVYVEAPDENGLMTEWEIETQSTPNLIRRGWTEDSLREGDVITVRANPDRDPEKNLLFGMTFTKADGTTLPSQGHSIGWWEDEVLVVDTVGFEEHRWGNGRGIPSGPERHAVERYMLSSDGTTVRIDYVIEDQEYLTEPVTGTINWRHARHLALLPYQCDPAVSRRFVAED